MKMRFSYCLKTLKCFEANKMLFCSLTALPGSNSYVS